jgi:YVTN family beta-propeller protein
MQYITKLMIIFALVGASLPSVAANSDKTTAQSLQLSGTLVVVNKSDNSVSLIDLSSQTIVDTLPTGQGPHELIVSGDGLWAVSTDFVGGDSLTVFDIAKRRVARKIDLTQYPGPHGITFLNDDKQVAFTSGKSKNLVVVDIHKGEVVRAIATQQNTTHMVTVGEQEDYAYTTNIRSNSISKIDLATHAVVKQIPTHDMPEAIKLTKDGKQLWYGANKEGLVTVLDTSTHKTLAQFEGFTFPYRVLFSQNEQIALVPDFSAHYVRFFDVKTKTELGQLSLPEKSGPQGIVLHPTLDIAFLSLNLANKVLAIDINSRTIIAEYPTGNNPDGIGYSSLVLLP